MSIEDCSDIVASNPAVSVFISVFEDMLRDTGQPLGLGNLEQVSN